uniref:hypothetical protein n=1 Tax=Escherichia coli TaxID=562 RepID=UPI001F29E873|nr:hypothetical protein [Escherichia coli]
MQKVPLFILLVLANCSFAYAGSDDGAFGDIWAYMSEALTGAPGKNHRVRHVVLGGLFRRCKT